MASPQPGQVTVAAAGSADRDRGVPQPGQNAAVSNISAKQDGQLTVASRAVQYGQRRASGSTAAPQFGQCSDEASEGIAFRIAVLPDS
jgi:hypothetical protein